MHFKVTTITTGNCPNRVTWCLTLQGNIYGTTPFGGGDYVCFSACAGVVFELTPSAGGWAENILFNFARLGGQPSQPYSGVISTVLATSMVRTIGARLVPASTAEFTSCPCLETVGI